MKPFIWAHPSEPALDPIFARFQSSFSLDRRLLKYEIAASMAHVKMLGGSGILDDKSVSQITNALEELQTGTEVIAGCSNDEFEDVHSLVEHLLVLKLGDLAKNVHIGRSRNDQVVTILKLYIRDEAAELSNLLRELMATFVLLADFHMTSREGRPAILPGYTHMQVAQPIHLSHWFMSFHEIFARDLGRIHDAAARMNECPLGAGAMCGTGWPIDRGLTSALLGFSGPQRNSLDAVGSRDFVVEFIFAISMVALNLSRLAEDLLLFSTQEFGFVGPSGSFSTGSSIMPQKRNSDFCELTRGKTGFFLGHLMGLMTAIKGLPSSYNRDLQEDKRYAFAVIDEVKVILKLWPKYLKSLKWSLSKMYQSAATSFSLATDLADELCRKGVPFRDSHSIVRQLVQFCLDNSLAKFSDVKPDELLAIHPMLTPSMIESLTVERSLSQRKGVGASGDVPLRDAIYAAQIEVTNVFRFR